MHDRATQREQALNNHLCCRCGVEKRRKMRIYRAYKLRFYTAPAPRPAGRSIMLFATPCSLRLLKSDRFLKTSVEWGFKYVDYCFWQGTMRRNNAL
jgi:hypothetical protein